MADTKTKPGSIVSTKQFSDNFLFGTATGAFQVEGAWDEDKSESIWDHYFHSNEASQSFRHYLDIPAEVYDRYMKQSVKPRLTNVMYKGMGVYEFPSTALKCGTRFNIDGNVVADTYHKTDTDVKLLRELGVQFYRFSISPTRIIPNVHDHLPGKSGIAYYNNLINKLIENEITSMVSLYHFDMGMDFNKAGGLTNSASYNFFTNYTRICFENFGDRVKYWTTTADIHLAAEGYDSQIFAPGYQETLFSGYSDYQVLHNCIIIHAMVYKLYNEEFKEKQQGQISITIEGTWFYPKDPNNPEHQKAAECARISTFGLIAHVLSTGRYPDAFLETIDKTNKREKIWVERVEQFTKKQQELIKGSFDFIVLNYFNSVKVRPMTDEEFTNEPNLKRRYRGYFMEFNNTTQTEIK